MSLDELARTSAASLLDATAARTDTVAGRAALGRTVQRRRVASMAAVAAGVAAVVVFGSVVLLRPTTPPVPQPAAPTGPGGVVVHCGGLLCTVDPTTGAVQQRPPWPGMTIAGEIVGVSPDGTEVAYVDGYRVEVAQLYGTTTRTMRIPYMSPPSLSWTSDGINVAWLLGNNVKLLLHISKESAGRITQHAAHRLYLPSVHLPPIPINPRCGGDPAACEPPGSAGTDLLLSWSPDGTHLAFSAPTTLHGERRLYVTDANGQNAHELSPPLDHQVLGVAWSPDGQHIAYIDATNHSGDLIVIDPDGSNRTDLGSVGASVEPSGHASIHYTGWRDLGPTTGSALAWSPDSQSIAFQGRDLQTPGWALYIRQLDGTTRRFDVPNLIGFSIGWAADSASTP